MNIVIFGPPGAGKGTQSKFIANQFNLHQLSTGELLRNEIKNKTELGSQISSLINAGELVSDDVVSNLIKQFISNNEFKNQYADFISSWRSTKDAATPSPYFTQENFAKKKFVSWHNLSLLLTSRDLIFSRDCFFLALPPSHSLLSFSCFRTIVSSRLRS